MEEKKLEFSPYRANEALENYFYMVPIELVNSSLYKGKLNSDSILLYSFLLSRFRLSVKNNWIDEDGYLYIVFPRAEAQELLNASDKTVTKAFELLKEAKLIQEKSFGKNKPKHIYVGKVQHLTDEKFIRHTKTNLVTRKNYDSGTGNFTTQDTENLRGRYIDNKNNNKDINKSNFKKKNYANYEQRSYPPEFYKSLYCNLKFEKGDNENGKEK